MECTHLQCINYGHLYVHNLQWGWSNEKLVGCPGNEHFHPVTSQHRAECSGYPQPKLKAMSPFPVGESSSFSLMFPVEVWKVQEESLQPPNSRRHWGVGYNEERLIFPPIQPMSLGISESDFSIWENKIGAFQHCSSEVYCQLLSLLSPGPCWDSKTISAVKKKSFQGWCSQTPAVLLFWEVTLHKKNSSPELQAPSSWNPLSPLPRPWQWSRLTFFTAKINKID